MILPILFFSQPTHLAFLVVTTVIFLPVNRITKTKISWMMQDATMPILLESMARRHRLL